MSFKKFKFGIFPTFFVVMIVNAISFIGIYWMMQSNASRAEDTAKKNQKLNSILGLLVKIELVAGDLNAPGNDIFESKNVDFEENRFRTYEKKFRSEFSILRQEIKNSLSSMNQERVIQKLDLVQTYSELFVKTTDSIFSSFRENNFEEASKKMAQMDRSYSEFRKAFIEMRLELRALDDQMGAEQYSIAHDQSEKIGLILVTNFLLSFILVALGIIAYRKSKSDSRILNFYKFALDQSAIVAMTDKKGKISYANEKFVSISGYKQAELLGQDHRILNSQLHPKEFFEILWKTIHSGNIWQGEVRNKKKDGSFYWVSSTIIPMKNEKGSVNEYVAIRHDITEKKKTEEQLVLAKAEAEAASKAKASFLANMSHEIRTPLNGILGMATLLYDENLTSDGKHHLDTMKNSGDTLLTLINDILDFSKIEAGKLNLEQISFSLEDTVQELVSLLYFRAKEKNLVVHIELDPSLPKHISADVTRLRQVLTNLIGNAIKFTQEGSITVRTSGSAINDEAYLIRLDIIDTGFGMSEEAQGALFKSFSQVDASTTRKFGGTGLGLAICKGICEAMGGEIWVESEVGKGSTFSFTFKAEKANVIPIWRKDPVAGSYDADLGAKYPFKILVADDHSTNQLLAKKFLEKMGYKPDIVGNGLEVLNALKLKSYDLIFMDGHMPEMDGYETTQKIHARYGKDKSPWIVAFTANASKEDQEKCYACGMNDFVAKPFSISALAQALTKAQGRGSNSKTEATPSHTSFNPAEILNHFAGDEALMNEVIRSFLSTLPEAIEKLESAIKSGNAHDLKTSAHALKGSAANFHVATLQQSLQELEDLGKNNQLVRANDQLISIKAQITQLKTNLESTLSGKRAAA